jgi:hypothetical protein
MERFERSEAPKFFEGKWVRPAVLGLLLSLGVSESQIYAAENSVVTTEASEQAELSEKTARIRAAIGDRAYAEVKESFFRQPEITKNENGPAIGELRVKGKENGDIVISPEDMAAFLGTFPDSWVRDEVNSIAQSDQDAGKFSSQSRKAYREVVSSEVVARNEPARFVNYDTKVVRVENKVLFTPVSRSLSAEVILNDTISHEVLGHLNDWENDNQMTAEERADLLLAVIARVKARNHYRSDYVEHIRHDDKKYELYQKAQEYWAEIVSQYFRNPQKLLPEDFRLVDQRVRATDPDFDIKKSLDDRAAIVARVKLQGQLAQL